MLATAAFDAAREGLFEESFRFSCIVFHGTGLY
jgi:hypothetical protein